jgi:hypothetical protein
MIEAEHVQDRRVEVVDVDASFHRVHPELVGRPVRVASLHSSAREQEGETGGVVVAAGGFRVLRRLRVRSPAELAAPHDERVVEQSAQLEVGDQCRRGAVAVGRERTVPLVVLLVRVPGLVVAFRQVVDLNVAHSSFGEPAREETGEAEIGLSVHLADRFRLPLDVESLGSFRLHAERHLHRSDLGFELCGGAPLHLVEPIQALQEVQLAPLSGAGHAGTPHVRDHAIHFEVRRVDGSTLVRAGQE